VRCTSDTEAGTVKVLTCARQIRVRLYTLELERFIYSCRCPHPSTKIFVWFGHFDGAFNPPFSPPPRLFALPLLPYCQQRHAQQQQQQSAQQAWDLIFVFSAAADLTEFRNLLSSRLEMANLTDAFIAIVDSPHVLNQGRVLGDASTITTKKFYGLLIAFPCYQMVVVFDVEVDIIDPSGLAAAVRAAAARGIVFHGRIAAANYAAANATCSCYNRSYSACAGFDFSSFIAGAIAYLPSTLRMSAEEATDSCNLYPWFSDVPVFLSADIPAFFADVGFPSAFPSHLVFDHLAYQLWKLARGDWRGVDLSTIGCGIGVRSLPELHDAPKLLSWRKHSAPGPLWAPASICWKDPSICTPENGTHVIYHLDRDFEWGAR
jgi:hypothetical protein